MADLKEVVFQAVPILRVSPPSTVPMGRRHKDRDYGHQPGQVNFWMPLCSAFGANSLFVEADNAHGASHPLEGDWGDIHRFYGNGLYHHTVPNTTGTTRISLDFRVVPMPLYDDDWPASRGRRNGQQQFFIGGYYKLCRKDAQSGRWSLDDDVIDVEL